ncbi:MAG: hypothetical protein WHU10_08690, partial [Fimbriimonadales bacterium]
MRNIHLILINLKPGTGCTLHGQLHPRHTGSLGDEGHSARCTRIDFQNVDNPVFHRVLDVHQPDHTQRLRQPFRVMPHGHDVFFRHHVCGDHTGTVTGMDTGQLNLFHD